MRLPVLLKLTAVAPTLAEICVVEAVEASARTPVMLNVLVALAGI